MKLKTIITVVAASMACIVLIPSKQEKSSFGSEAGNRDNSDNKLIGLWRPVKESQIGDIGIMPKNGQMVVVIPRFNKQLTNVDMKNESTMVVHLSERTEDTVAIRYLSESGNILVSGEGEYTKGK